MGSAVTAVVLSKHPIRRRLPGVKVLNYVSTIENAADQFASRAAAVRLVDTPRFFFLDDTDELPPGYLSLFDRAAHVALVHTDERVNGARRTGGHWTREGHLANPLLVHHLALCDTALARQALGFLEPGPYWPEFLLYHALALHSSAYMPEVGYLWNKRPGGLHDNHHTLMGQVLAVRWARDNMKENPWQPKAHSSACSTRP